MSFYKDLKIVKHDQWTTIERNMLRRLPLTRPSKHLSKLQRPPTVSLR